MPNKGIWLSMAVLILMLVACSAAAQGQRLTGPTDSFEFMVIDKGTAYSVSAGTVIEGQ